MDNIKSLGAQINYTWIIPVLLIKKNSGRLLTFKSAYTNLLYYKDLAGLGNNCYFKIEKIVWLSQNAEKIYHKHRQYNTSTLALAQL